MSRREEIKNLLTRHYRRLQKLKEQKAVFGLHAPPHILIEIEDVEVEVKLLENELKNLESTEASIKTNFVKEIKQKLIKSKTTIEKTNDIEKREKVIKKLEDYIDRLEKIQADIPVVQSIMSDTTSIMVTEQFDRLSRIIYEFLSKTISKAEAEQFSSKARLPFGSNRPFGPNPYLEFRFDTSYSDLNFKKRHLSPAIAYLVALKEAIEKGDQNIK